jgi:putative membrane protein
MSKFGIVLIAVFAMFSSSALASGLANKFNDPQIAKIAYVAGEVDIEAAQQALGKTQSPEVKAFAQDMIRDHTAINDQVLALLKKLHVAPRDTDVSRYMVKHAEEVRSELGKLNGADFDRAYMQNEVNYHLQVDFTLEKKLIPEITDPELKALLATALTTFKGHEQRAEKLVASLKTAAP